jgi:hypothetical protein
MFKRTLLTIAFVAASGVAMAQTTPNANQPSGGTSPGGTSPGGASMPERGATASPTSPLASEGLAKSKLEASGYSGIKDLRESPDGTWTGKAMKDSREMAVSVDAQGNVTAK